MATTSPIAKNSGLSGMLGTPRSTAGRRRSSPDYLSRLDNGSLAKATVSSLRGYMDVWPDCWTSWSYLPVGSSFWLTLLAAIQDRSMFAKGLVTVLTVKIEKLSHR